MSRIKKKKRNKRKKENVNAFGNIYVNLFQDKHMQVSRFLVFVQFVQLFY